MTLTNIQKLPPRRDLIQILYLPPFCYSPGLANTTPQQLLHLLSVEQAKQDESKCSAMCLGGFDLQVLALHFGPML